MQLNELLSQRETITAMAKRLGFVNIRLYVNKEEMSKLHFLVALDGENATVRSYHTPALEAELIQLLSSDLHVLVDSTLKSLYRDSILKHSASLEDEEGLAKLYKKPLSEITIDTRSSDDEDIKRNLALAEKLKNLSKQSSANNATFFSESSPASSSKKQKVASEEIVKKILDNPKTAEAVLSSLDQDTLDKINNAFGQSPKLVY